MLSDTELALERALSVQPSAYVRSAKTAAFEDLGLSFGLRVCVSKESQKLAIEVEKRAPELDKLFSFGALTVQPQRASVGAIGDPNALLMPPVLMATKSAMNATATTLQIADLEYGIISPPRYATTIPTWRQYVLPSLRGFGSDAPEMNLPKTVTVEDRAAFNAAARRGCSVGIEQAKQSLKVALEQVTRDITGMQLYHELLAKGMVTRPIEVERRTSAMDSGNKLQVNVRQFTIKAAPKFNADVSKWNAQVEIANNVVSK